MIRRRRITQRRFNRRANKIRADFPHLDREWVAERAKSEILEEFDRERAALRTPAEIKLENLSTSTKGQRGV